MKYKTFISQEEMIKAKTDELTLMNILNRIEPYITYMAIRAHRSYYTNNNAYDIEDIKQTIKIELVKAIKKYYKVDNYDPLKDKNKVYKNAFTFIIITTKYIMNRFKQITKAKKKINYNKIVYIDQLETEQEKNKLDKEMAFNISKKDSNVLKKFIKKKINNKFSNKYKTVLNDMLDMKYKNFNDIKKKNNFNDKDIEEMLNIFKNV